MRLVNKNKLLAPGKCLVCERVPDKRVVDTLIKNFNNVASHPLRGRKYVCERCGSKIAEALAYPSPSVVSGWQDTIERLKERVIDLERNAELESKVDDLRAFIEGQNAPTVED